MKREGAMPPGRNEEPDELKPARLKVIRAENTWRYELVS